MATSAIAQDAGNGVTLSVSQNLSYSNNLDFNAAETSGLRSVTGLNLGYSSQTRSEGFTFSASTNAEFGTDDNAENTFADPVLQLSYRREAKNAGLTADANYRRADVTSILGTDDIIDAGFITIDNGLQTDLGYGIGFDFGRTDPISGSISLSGNSRVYTDTADPDLLDLDSRSLSARVNLRFDPRITGRITANLSQYEEDGGITRNTTRVGLGANFAVSQTLTVDASVSLDETERTESGVTSTTDGIGFALSAAQDVKGGSITASLSSNVNENGRNTNVSFGRSFELKNGSFEFSLGGVQRDSDDAFNPTYSLSFAQELPRGAQLSLQASQAYETDGTGDEAINSSVSANYSTPISPVSSLTASVNYRDTNGLGSNTDDATRLDLGVSYTHALAQDWGLTGGYNRSFASEDGGQDRTSDTVFVGLQKTFEWRP